MILIYAFAALSLVFVVYLVRDFYNEQFRNPLAPVRARRNGMLRRRRRD